MAKIATIGGKLIRVGEKLGLAPSCCCGGDIIGTCCEYGPTFPLDFTASGDVNGNVFNVSGTLTNFSWFDEEGNSLLIGPCSSIPEENVYLGVVPGFAVSFTPASLGYPLSGGIPTQYIETWPCDQIKNIAGSSAYLLGAFQINVGSVTFS